MSKLNGVDDLYGSDNLPQVVTGQDIGGYNEFQWEDAWDWDTQELVNDLWAIKRKEASDYLDIIADPTCLEIPDSYVDSNDLLSVFLWEDTPQGYGFWEEIYHELVSESRAEYPEDFEHG